MIKPVNCILTALPAIFFSSVLTLNAQLDVRSQLTASSLARQTTNRQSGHAMAVSAADVYVPVIVQLENPDTGVDSLLDLGAKVFYRRGDMALACMPPDLVVDDGRLHYINSLYIGRRVTAVNDCSRSVCGVNRVHTAEELAYGYDGEGVVAGICDIGIDPHHVALAGRIGMFSTYADTLGLRSVWAPGTSLDTGAELVADTDDQTHGTHVANILGGGRDNNPYYGAAPGADLALSASQLTDVGLLCGIEDIIAYAREQGKPAAINLSMGSYLGPHDGTDLVNRYLSLLADDALICFSAGNNGHRAFSLMHTLGADSPISTDGLPTIGSLFESRITWSGFDVLGSLDIWSADSTPLQFQLVIWDIYTRSYVYQSEWIASLGSDPGNRGTFCIDCSNNDVFGSLMADDCFIRASYGTDASNGRFTIALDYYINPLDELPDAGQHWARYMAGWRVRGYEGTHFDAFTDGTISFMRNYVAPGMVDGNADFSVSNLCASGRVMCVGSWNSRNSFPIAGSDDRLSLDFEVNTVTNWSSYGQLADGSPLPHICAPGNSVISAMSGPYLAKYPDAETISYSADVDGVSHAWYQQAGTSMSSPMVAGILALWLQADPSLTIERAIEVAQSTARTDFEDITDPRWGAGAIDAYAGLKHIIENSSAIDVVKPRPAVMVRNGAIEVSCPPGVTVRAFDVTGRSVPLDTPLPLGLYIVTGQDFSYKLVIR